MATRPKVFLVWGAGGHGRVVADLIRETGSQVRGFVDKDPKKALVTHQEDELLESLLVLHVNPAGIDAWALGIGDNTLRQRRLQVLEGLEAPPLVHPSASISASARIGPGSVVFPHAVVNAGAQIGEAVIVNSGAIIEHDCVLESAVHVSPGAILCGGVRIGQRSWIGAGATVIHGTTIGEDAVVGAGSTVIHDVDNSVTVIGSPARSSKV